MYTCTLHLGFVKEIVTKGLWKSFFELVIRISNKQTCDLLICFISIKIMNQGELLCILVILIWNNSKYKIITCSDVSQPLYVDIF